MDYMKIDTLALLKEGKLTYFEIAKKLRIGITAINKQVKELKKEGMITQNIEITTKGLEELKNKKVENAIILAAGWGSRMSPASDNTPKPLVKINGIPMVEITIKNLIKANIKDITIITGKLASAFDYLKEKYNVKLIFNNEWNKRNNIGSLEKVKDLLSNTLILEGDAPLYSDKIIINYINNPIYYGTYNEGPTSEWIMKTRGNNILSIHAGGEDGYIWKGGWYSNKMSSDAYREWFKNYYDNPKYKDADAAYILIEILQKLNKYIRLYKINDLDMVEIDTFDELCEIDSSYKEKYGII